MANRPVFGVVECPYCRKRNPTAWNGNFKIHCYNCKKPFNVKRQKLKFVTSLYGGKKNNG